MSEIKGVLTQRPIFFVLGKLCTYFFHQMKCRKIVTLIIGNNDHFMTLSLKNLTPKRKNYETLVKKNDKPRCNIAKNADFFTYFFPYAPKITKSLKEKGEKILIFDNLISLQTLALSS